KSPHHNTSFEMLGNFSFKDYTKKEAISFAWEFLTTILKIEINKLNVTVHKKDLETLSIWKNIIKIDNTKIKIGNNSTNFWTMDSTGPCGYCSEIFYEVKNKNTKKKKLLEIWNLVFMQFNKCSSKKLVKLEKISIDTGMGLERIASVIQNVFDNYKIDIIYPLINITINTLLINNKNQTSIRIVVDHIKTCILLINERLLPSNDGRGYIIRKLIRKAIIHKNKLKTPVKLYKLVSPFIDELKINYNHTYDKTIIENIIKSEEIKFESTIKIGLLYLNKILATRNITGKDLFLLYDTYGLPIEFAEEITKTKNIKINISEFNKELLTQKTREIKTRIKKENIYNLEKTEFLGYDNVSITSKIKKILIDNKNTEKITIGENGIIITEKTSFYAEKGGQVGDTGIIYNEKNIFKVKNTQENNNLHLHYGVMEHGELKINDTINTTINEKNRKEITNNHTTTHLLNAALQKTLGKHIKQSGSLINENYLRFDFIHFKQLDQNEILKIENMINEQICLNFKVETSIKNTIETDNYSKCIRTVKIGDTISEELCAGTHVKTTGEVRFFKIIKEFGIGSNIRRIEAITGETALALIRDYTKIIYNLTQLLKVNAINLLQETNKLTLENKKLKKEAEYLSINEIRNNIKNTNKIICNNGIEIFNFETEHKNIQLFKHLIDEYKNSIIILYAKVQIVTHFTIYITNDLIKKISINKILEIITEKTNCKGGGKLHIANGIINNYCDMKEISKYIYSYINAL
ncbi:MAG: alanine--tRNA ligase, partial [Enterobacteriaceae bacterium]|nr:alanine--tRNA ligase [Enterobacteriaceae bacterium]